MKDIETYISVKNLYKKYKDIIAVNDLSLTVYKGDIYGFLGPNGAGKSTTIRILLSLIKKDDGGVTIFNQSISKNREHVLSRIGALIEKPDFYPYLSAYKNLEILSKYSRGDISHNRIFEILELVGLKERAYSKVKTFSHGMKQRLGIAQALIHDPDLLILDEPGNGLDPLGTKEIRDLMLYLNKEDKKTIFISSHLLSEVELVATRMIIINKGHHVVEGSVKELLNTKELKVKFEVDDIKKTLNLLESTKYMELLEGKKEKELKFSMSKEEISDLNKLLVENNIKVEAIKPLRNLEEYFLQITEN